METKIIKITHAYPSTPDGVYIETEMDIPELEKIMHLWQIKLFNQEETMDFSEEDMANILESYGCRKVDEAKTIDEEIDLYMLWEYGVQTRNPMVTDDDLVDPKYVNEKALEVMNQVIKITNEYYERQRAERI